MRARAVVSSILICVLAPASVAVAAPDKKACFKLADEGQDLRAAGKLREAREKFLACAKDPCPSVVRSDCTKWIGEVDAEMPSIVVKVTRGGSDLTEARVSIDGAETSTTLDGTSVAVDPGTHEIVVEPKGEAKLTQKVVVARGEKNRVVAFTVAVPEPAKKDQPPPPPPEAPASSGPPTWAFVAAGVGVVGLAGFTVFGLAGRAKVNDLESRGCEPRCPDSDVRDAKTKFLIGDISLAVGVVSLGLATYGFLSGKSDREKPATQAHFGVAPGLAWAGIGGVF
jgi:hypothetical protein